MFTHTAVERDALQVCRLGHVITAKMRSKAHEARVHCDRCGAATLSGCPSCGLDLPGAWVSEELGLPTLGERQPPSHCEGCGSAFPWTKPRTLSRRFAELETFARRLPNSLRALQSRQQSRPTLTVRDEHDLADFLRVALALCTDEVQTVSRLARYSDRDRHDFWLPADQVTLVGHLVEPATALQTLMQYWQEDWLYHVATRRVGQVWCVLFDLASAIVKPESLELQGQCEDGAMQGRLLVLR